MSTASTPHTTRPAARQPRRGRRVGASGGAGTALLGGGSAGDSMSFSVSTSALGPALIVTVIAVAAAMWVLRAGGPAQPATRPLRTDRARVTSRDVQRS